MHVYTLERRQVVPRTLDQVFPFFARPENLEPLTPAVLRFRFLTPTPIEMKEGALIDYALRIRGVPVHWRTLITHYDPPHGFVDQQLKGPYLMWHHTHTFREVAGGVEIGDTVRYVMPFGPLGRLARALLVRRDLDAIFDFRARAIDRRFGARTSEPNEG